MDNINDLYKIINNKYSDSTSSLYQEVLNKEEIVRNTIDRVINMKEKEKFNNLFPKTSLENIHINIFKTLNSILEELSNVNELTYSQFNKIFQKDNRLIYIGIFFIILAVSLMLIEISDNI